MTFPAHFPDVGEAVQIMFPQSGGAPIDGVIAMDPYIVQALHEVHRAHHPHRSRRHRATRPRRRSSCSKASTTSSPPAPTTNASKPSTRSANR